MERKWREQRVAVEQRSYSIIVSKMITNLDLDNWIEGYSVDYLLSEPTHSNRLHRKVSEINVSIEFSNTRVAIRGSGQLLSEITSNCKYVRHY